MFLHSGNWFFFLTSYKSGSLTCPGRALELSKWAFGDFKVLVSLPFGHIINLRKKEEISSFTHQGILAPGTVLGNSRPQMLLKNK